MNVQTFGHFAVGLADEDFLVVVLHIRSNRDIFGTSAHAIAAAGAEAVHIFGDVAANALDIVLRERFGAVGHAAGGVDVLAGGKADQGDGNLRAADTESNGRFGCSFAGTCQKGKLFFVGGDDAAGQRIHGDYAHAGLMCRFDAFPSIQEIQDIDSH